MLQDYFVLCYTSSSFSTLLGCAEHLLYCLSVLVLTSVFVTTVPHTILPNGEMGRSCCTHGGNAKWVQNHSLTPWCSVLFEKLIVTQLVKNILLSYGTRGFITVFTQAHHWTLS
jgi:hypothetical protein